MDERMCDATPPAAITLPPRPESAGAARAFLAERHCGEHAALVLDDAVLLVSELVSNAVRHGSPPVTVETECDATNALAVRVSDASPALPQPGPGLSEVAESGRGLSILDILSDMWGVDPRSDGKTVWFRLLPRGGEVVQDDVDARQHAVDLRESGRSPRESDQDEARPDTTKGARFPIA